jgi:general L-amino acid transport system substrate-binding protein
MTQANVDKLKNSTLDPVIQRILGTTEDTGRLLGLDKEWMLRSLKATGNYGEIFERNLGPKSAIGLPRGLNKQWNQGGLMYAYPLR